MKKVSIIILLTALILGAFTACNGDVFSDLMPKPEPTSKGTITLEIPEGTGWSDVSFDNTEDVRTKELEIPKDCETWAEYLEKVTDIKLYLNDTDNPRDYTLMEKDGKVYFCWWKESEQIYRPSIGLKLDDSKYSVPDTVDASATIEIGGTYTLTTQSPT